MAALALQVLWCFIAAILPVWSVMVEASHSYQMRLSTLVLATSEEDLAVPRVFLEGVGTHYVVQMDKLPVLETHAGPLFSSIIITNDEGMWGTSKQLEAVRAYAKKYNIRIVFLKLSRSRTVLDSGLSVSMVAPVTHIEFDQTAIMHDPALADLMNEKETWKMWLPVMIQPTPLDVISGTSAESFSFMRFKTGENSTVDGGIAAAISKTRHGTEEMYFAFDATYAEICTEAKLCQDTLNFIQYGEDTLFSFALANVWFAWVTRGVFLGQRKAVFQLHVDDWYSETEIFKMPGPNNNFRCNGDDVNYVVHWQKTMAEDLGLPDGTDFRFELAYNAANTFANSEADEAADKEGKSLNKASFKHIDEFNWVSHTWTHQHLDWATGDYCDGVNYKCHLKQDRMDAEVHYNQLFAEAKDIIINRTIFPDDVEYEDDTPGRLVTPIPAERYSPSCLVTPEISGLYPRWYQWDSESWPSWSGQPRPDNVHLHNVFKRRGVTCVTGDNSRYELVANTSYHHPIITDENSYNVTGLTIIPRHTLIIPYDVHDEEYYVISYNDESGYKCFGTPGPACVEGETSTYDEAMDRQAYSAVYFLLQYRQDPYMFHQANLHAFTRESGQQVTHLTYFAEKTLSKFVKYLNKMPIKSPKMEMTCENYRERLARDMCMPEAFVEVEDNKWNSIKIQGDENCQGATALLTLRRCNHHALKNLKAYRNGLDAVYKLPFDYNTGSAHTFVMSDDTEKCTSADAPEIAHPKPPPTSSSTAAEPSVTESKSSEGELAERSAAERPWASAFVTVGSITTLAMLFSLLM